MTLLWVFVCLSVFWGTALGDDTTTTGESICGANGACVTLSPDGKFDIFIDTVFFNNITYLRSLAPYLHANAQRYSVEEGTLKVTTRGRHSGSDVHGEWNSLSIHYEAGSEKLPFVIAAKVYTKAPILIFEQYFPEGANQTSIGSPNLALSGFPRFVVGQPTGLGFLNYGGMFAGDTTKWMGIWSQLTINLRDGVPGGPLALFDKDGRVFVISAYNNFMTSVYEHRGIMGGELSYGIMGSVQNVPRGHTLQTVVYFGENGINEAFEGWGLVMRRQYGRHDDFVKSDFSVNYLGYWTDNGAYYYYETEPNKTYDQTLLDVQAYAQSLSIPYRYVQYDSWWYFMGPLGGVTKWEGQPEVFPKGMHDLYNRTGWPVVAHNRWWSSQTPYSKANGGRFHFLTETLKAVPMDEAFWDWLFKTSKLWGLITYEQDWLDAQLLGLEGLQNNVDNARRWLLLMGKSADKNNLNLQYCMAFPRHVLQALEIPRVTQVRVSDDYQPGQSDWKIGVSSMFAHALRISPYKDSFWTTSVQPGNPYGLSESHPALHAVASVLSTGPVGPADAIGKTNVSLLMRCCNADGLILKPDKPATAVDRQILEAAFRDGVGPRGEAWSTYSTVSNLTFGIILAADMKPDYSYNVTPSTAGLSKKIAKSKVFLDNPTGPRVVQSFSEKQPLTLHGCSDTDFCLYHTTPVLRLRNKELLLYGEISKWVPMSTKRFTAIRLSGSDVTIELTGATNERVEIWYSLGGEVIHVNCHVTQTGRATLSVWKRRCS